MSEIVLFFLAVCANFYPKCSIEAVSECASASVYECRSVCECMSVHLCMHDQAIFMKTRFHFTWLQKWNFNRIYSVI